MRKNDIEEILYDIALKISDIEHIYEVSKENDEIKNVNSPMVKNVIENLRSVLDYSACDIYEYVYNKNIEGSKKRVYFPFSDTPKGYDTVVESNFPNLKIMNTEIYNIGRSIQSFVQAETYIYELCKLSNYYKHYGLKKQERENSGAIKTNIKSKDLRHNFVEIINSNVIIENCTFGDANIEKLEISTDGTISGIDSEISSKLDIMKKNEIVKFSIDDLDILTLITSSYKAIKEYIDCIYTVIK